MFRNIVETNLVQNARFSLTSINPCLSIYFPYLCGAKSINKYHCGWRLNDLALYESINNIQTQRRNQRILLGKLYAAKYAAIKAKYIDEDQTCDATEADHSCCLSLANKIKNRRFLYKILDDSSKYHLTIKQKTI